MTLQQEEDLRILRDVAARRHHKSINLNNFTIQEVENEDSSSSSDDEKFEESPKKPRKKLIAPELSTKTRTNSVHTVENLSEINNNNNKHRRSIKKNDGSNFDIENEEIAFEDDIDDDESDKKSDTIDIDTIENENNRIPETPSYQKIRNIVSLYKNTQQNNDDSDYSVESKEFNEEKFRENNFKYDWNPFISIFFQLNPSYQIFLETNFIKSYVYKYTITPSQFAYNEVYVLRKKRLLYIEELKRLDKAKQADRFDVSKLDEYKQKNIKATTKQYDPKMPRPSMLIHNDRQSYAPRNTVMANVNKDPNRPSNHVKFNNNGDNVHLSTVSLGSNINGIEMSSPVSLGANTGRSTLLSPGGNQPIIQGNGLAPTSTHSLGDDLPPTIIPLRSRETMENNIKNNMTKNITLNIGPTINLNKKKKKIEHHY